MKKIIVTIPAYNEEETIGIVVNEIKKINKNYTVLVVDDGSKDKTAEIAKKNGAILLFQF